VTESLRIGIAGAGIMGRLLAWQLCQAGHRVTLFDRDPIETGNAAAYTAAGMLTPFAEVESAELLIYQMGMHSLSLWPLLAKQLGGDLGFYQRGTLVVSHAQDRAELKRFNQQLDFKLQQGAINPDPAPRQLDATELAQYEPQLAAQFNQATLLPGEAWLCTKCVMRTLAEQLLAKRVAWYSSTTVDQVGPGYLQTGKQRYEFDWVVDCRGLGAKGDLSGLRGVRGELVWLQAPEVQITHLVRLMHPRYRLYLVPKGRDDLYILGATQIESEDFSPISVRSTLELLSAAYSLHPGFAEARVVETKTNCRPALSDNLPRVITQPGLVQINGLYRHGFLLAPAIAEQVSAFLGEAVVGLPIFPPLFESWEALA